MGEGTFADKNRHVDDVEIFKSTIEALPESSMQSLKKMCVSCVGCRTFPRMKEGRLGLTNTW